jgi:hypothetical protein
LVGKRSVLASFSGPEAVANIAALERYRRIIARIDMGCYAIRVAFRPFAVRVMNAFTASRLRNALRAGARASFYLALSSWRWRLSRSRFMSINLFHQRAKLCFQRFGRDVIEIGETFGLLFPTQPREHGASFDRFCRFDRFRAPRIAGDAVIIVARNNDLFVRVLMPNRSRNR